MVEASGGRAILADSAFMKTYGGFLRRPGKAPKVMRQTTMAQNFAAKNKPVKMPTPAKPKGQP